MSGGSESLPLRDDAFGCFGPARLALRRLFAAAEVRQRPLVTGRKRLKLSVFLSVSQRSTSSYSFELPNVIEPMWLLAPPPVVSMGYRIVSDPFFAGSTRWRSRPR